MKLLKIIAQLFKNKKLKSGDRFVRRQFYELTRRNLALPIRMY